MPRMSVVLTEWQKDKLGVKYSPEKHGRAAANLLLLNPNFKLDEHQIEKRTSE